MQQLTIRIKSGQPQKRFSEAFKNEKVRDYEQGLLNKDQIKIKYGLGGNSTVSQSLFTGCSKEPFSKQFYTSWVYFIYLQKWLLD